MTAKAKFALVAEDQSAGVFNRFRTRLTGLAGVAGRLKKSGAFDLFPGGKLLAGGGLAALTGGLLSKGKQSFTEAAQIKRLSDRLGASTEFLSEMRHVTALSGVPFQQFTVGLQRMTRRIGQAADGTGEASGVLRQFGLDASKLTKLPPGRQFEIITDRLSGMEKGGRRTAAAMKLFDSEGVSLLQTMEGGLSLLRQRRQEARDRGLSISGRQGENAVLADQAAVGLRSRFDGFMQRESLKLGEDIRTLEGMTLNKFGRLFQSELQGAGEMLTNMLRGIDNDKATEKMIARRTRILDEGVGGREPRRDTSKVEQLLEKQNQLIKQQTNFIIRHSDGTRVPVAG